MKRFTLLAGIILFWLGFGLSGCEDEPSPENSNGRCNVQYVVVYINTSTDDMYMGNTSQPSASHLVTAGSSRTQPGEFVDLLTTGNVESATVEMNIRSLDGQYYNYASYTILPSEWPVHTNNTIFPNSTLSLQINCVFDGTSVNVTATEF